MPFTAAHTVAVFPFLRSGKLCATALIAGSMAPDFEYFIRVGTRGIWGHDVLGIFLFDLPMTVLMVFVFHSVVKKNLINNLPAFLQRRFGHLRESNAREDIFARPLTFALCACIGAATHVMWDGFTHNGGYFVKALPWIYKGSFVHFDGVNYPLWYVLQHVSTAIGMTILFVYILLMKPVSNRIVKPKIGYWLALGATAIGVVFVRLQFPHTTGSPMVVISAISGLCLGLIILGLLPQRSQTLSGPQADG